MIGQTKLSTIRREARKAFKLSDADLLAWFNRQLEELGPKRKTNKTEAETLRLLRDALVKKGKPPGAGHQPRRLTGRSKKSKSQRDRKTITNRS